MRARWPRIAAATLVAAVVPTIGAVERAGATSSTLTPTALTVEYGPAAGGLGAAQTVDGTALQLGPGISRSYLTYQLPAALNVATVWSFTVKASVTAPTTKQQRWTWFLRDFAGKRWSKLGDNIEIANANPAVLRFYPPGPFARYVSTTGALQVRMVSAKKPVTLGLDAEWIELEHGTPPSFPGWTPPVGVRWQYQLQPPVDASITAVPFTGGAPVHPGVFDIDLYDVDGVTPAADAVAAIHAQGARAVCYVDAGTWENWRPDAGAYPIAVRGRGNGWPGERWVDVRRLDVLVPIIAARVHLCVTAGFDAVEYDNMDAASNHSGFPVSAAQQIEFNRAMAAVAHANGLAVGLKNDVGQLTQLEPWFEFAINEQCQQYSECGGYDAWIAHAKAVVQVEYTSPLATFCPPAIAAGRSAIRKALALLATPYTPCN